MKNLTQKETKAIDRLSKAFKSMPNSLKIYVIDDTVIVCKKGVSSYEVNEAIHCPVFPGSMLTDIHDDFNFGNS